MAATSKRPLSVENKMKKLSNNSINQNQLHQEDGEIIPPPKRPEILDKILNTTAQRDDYDLQLYRQFIENAYITNKTNSNSFRVNFSWIYADDPISNYSNCSLCAIFFFYTKIQLPSTKLHIQPSKLTSDDEVIGRSCLSMYELFLLLRDFRIIPKLISREEVLFIWKLITSMKKTRREEIVLLEFPDFQELFARIAILTFNKPMIQRIVVSSQGKMPSYENQILALAHYIHLDDYNWVKHRLQTVGAHTVSLLDTRNGEINPMRKDLLRDEVKGKRIANWLAQGDLTSASSGGHVNIAQMKTIMDSTYQNSQRSPAEQNESKKNMGVEGNQTQTLLDQVISQLKSEGQWSLESETDPSTFPPPQSGIQYSSENHLFSHSTLPQNQLLTPAPIHTPSLLLLGGIKLSQTQEDALIRYYPIYTRVLDRYSDLQAYNFHKSTQYDPEREARGCDSGLLDMGTLEEGKDVIVRLHITNQSGSEMNVEVNVDRIAPVESMRITALPESLAPGLSKTAYIAFTVPTLPERRRNHSFHITVHGISTQVLNNTIHAVSRGESGIIRNDIKSRGKSRIQTHSYKSTEAVVCQEYVVFSRIFQEEFFHTPPTGGKRVGNGVPQASYQAYPHCTSESLERLYRTILSQQSTIPTPNYHQFHEENASTLLNSYIPKTTATRPKSAGMIRPSPPPKGHPKASLRNR